MIRANEYIMSDFLIKRNVNMLELHEPNHYKSTKLQLEGELNSYDVLVDSIVLRSFLFERLSRPYICFPHGSKIPMSVYCSEVPPNSPSSKFVSLEIGTAQLIYRSVDLCLTYVTHF